MHGHGAVHLWYCPTGNRQGENRQTTPVESPVSAIVNQQKTPKFSRDLSTEGKKESDEMEKSRHFCFSARPFCPRGRARKFLER